LPIPTIIIDKGSPDASTISSIDFAKSLITPSARIKRTV
jgi:hypothetical protein